MNGIFIIYQQGKKIGKRIEKMPIYDIAPTI